MGKFQQGFIQGNSFRIDQPLYEVVCDNTTLDLVSLRRAAEKVFQDCRGAKVQILKWNQQLGTKTVVATKRTRNPGKTTLQEMIVAAKKLAKKS